MLIELAERIDQNDSLQYFKLGSYLDMSFPSLKRILKKSKTLPEAAFTMLRRTILPRFDVGFMRGHVLKLARAYTAIGLRELLCSIAAKHGYSRLIPERAAASNAEGVAPAPPPDNIFFPAPNESDSDSFVYFDQGLDHELNQQMQPCAGGFDTVD